MQINKQLIDSFINQANWKAVWDEDTFSQRDPSALELSLDYNKFEWMSGATKMVFQPVDPAEQYVIKVPFRFIAEENFDYDEEEEDAYIYNEIFYAPLPKSGVYNGGFYQYTWDYCATELQYYELAQDAGIVQFFPETTQYCKIPYPIYLQETCYPVFLKHNTSNWQKRETIAEHLSKHSTVNVDHWCNTFNPSWIQDSIDVYGEAKVLELFQFMTDFRMKDFHSSNY